MPCIVLTLFAFVAISDGNQAYDNMGLQTTQNMGCMLDGMMRNTPEAHAFINTANTQGVGAAVAERDGPFGDYSQASADRKPGKRSRD